MGVYGSCSNYSYKELLELKAVATNTTTNTNTNTNTNTVMLITKTNTCSPPTFESHRKAQGARASVS